MYAVIIRLALTATIVATATGCSGPSSPTNDDPHVNAAAIRAEVEAALSEVPVPPGDRVKVDINDDSGSYEVGSGIQLVESQAMCRWFIYWLRGISTSDAGVVTAAMGAAAKFPTWQNYTAADQSFRDLINKVVTNAKRGDPSTMAQYVSANCDGLP